MCYTPALATTLDHASYTNGKCVMKRAVDISDLVMLDAKEQSTIERET